MYVQCTHLLIRRCYLQLVVVHHLVADRRQEELLVLLQPGACLVVHGHSHPSLFKTHCLWVCFGFSMSARSQQTCCRSRICGQTGSCDPPSTTRSARFSSFSISPPGTPAPRGTTGHLTTCLVFSVWRTCVVFLEGHTSLIMATIEKGTKNFM